MTLNEIRRELREIRTYYASENLFKKSADKGYPSAVKSMVDKYNRAMENAPAMLYVVYVSLYVNNNTQAVVAEDLGYTTEYIKYQNSLLCKYLFENLHGGKQ